MQALQTFQHARVHLRMLAVDEQVVVLVTLQRQFTHLFARPAQRHTVGGHHLGQGQLVVQNGAHQVLGALAHRALDHQTIHRWQTDVLQRVVERDDEVAQRVDHRAVEVDDHGLDARQHQASALRMSSMTLL
ncbi:hypothetical protein Y695_02873 [Hydrogenophaga sp. T4]|nr:hypothetical protein Y695_02873 [Hydrogenophaga sp. T4]